MHKLWRQALLALSVSGLLLAQESQWKDRAEYDLVQEIQKAADPAKRIPLLLQWEEKYPDSKFAGPRLQAILTTYQAMGNAQGMKDTALKMIKADAKSADGYQWVCLLTESMQTKDAGALADGEKACKSLLEVLPSQTKPAQVNDQQWTAIQKDREASAHRVLGYIAFTGSKYPEAVAAYESSLKVNANQAGVNLQAATSILRQKDPEKQALALYHYARAATLAGTPQQGALPDAAKKQAMDFFKKNYVLLRGDESGMQEFVDGTKNSPVPPAGTEIENVQAAMIKRKNALAQTNPQLYLWLNVKENLVGATGEDYFKDNVKGSDLPKLKGKLVRTEPETKPHTLYLALDGDKEEIKVVLDVLLPEKADAGTELEFKGIPSEFVKDPFLLTVEVEKDQIFGWPGKGPMVPKPAAVKGAKPVAPRKPAVGVKKK